MQCCYYGHGFFSVFFDYRNLICGNVSVRGLVIDVRKTGVHVGDNKSQSWKCVCMWFLCEALICSAHRIVILGLKSNIYLNFIIDQSLSAWCYDG